MYMVLLTMHEVMTPVSLSVSLSLNHFHYQEICVSHIVKHIEWHSHVYGLSLSRSLCLSVCLTVSLPLYVTQSVSVSVPLSRSLCLSQSVTLYACMSVCMSFCRSQSLSLSRNMRLTYRKTEHMKYHGRIFLPWKLYSANSTIIIRIKLSKCSILCKHRWLSGRMLACQTGGPVSI